MHFVDQVGIEAQGLGEFDIMDCPLKLGSGAYNIKITYNSISNYENTNIDNCAGKIVLDTNNSAILKASEIPLCDGLNEMQSRFWIRSGIENDEVKIHVRYYGNGKLSIKSIQVEERREFRVLTCIVVIIVMVICNLIYLFY